MLSSYHYFTVLSIHFTKHNETFHETIQGGSMHFFSRMTKLNIDKRQAQC